MSGEGLGDHAERFLTAARTHRECRGGRVVSADDSSAVVELDIKVEMPLHMRTDGVSESGVRRTEIVTTRLGPRYPWSPPTFLLREDFPRNFPHLQPGPLTEQPRPCLIDGSEREYFIQFGLVELGVFNLVHQLVLWLRHAAEGVLIDKRQGWEPTLRRDLFADIVIDAEACRAAVNRDGGYRVLKARYLRAGSSDSAIGPDVLALIDVTSQQVPLSRQDDELLTHGASDCSASGNTVCCVSWPDKLPSGRPRIADTYMPETVTTYGDLLARADEIGCGRNLRVFFDSLERCFRNRAFNNPVVIPVAIVLCARRPFHLIGSASDIELLPYVLHIRPSQGRTSLIAGGNHEPVASAIQRDSPNPALLRRVSGAPELPPVAILGCGSVGSKMTMHLARSGVQIPVVSDKSTLLPHNMARHALARPPIARSKAAELAAELSLIGQSPQIHEDDLVFDLPVRDKRRILLPKDAGCAVNTTASLAVREALSSLPAKEVKPRLAEAALFGRGQGGFLLIDGADHNPTLSDLTAELYATATSPRLRALLFDPAHGLTEVQIGQGCSSLTMPMTDMRLSAMTAGLTEQLVQELQTGAGAGRIIMATTAEDAPDTSWSRQSVAPFAVVDVEGSDGWTLRISRRVLDEIHAEIARWPAVETGGLMIGTCSARLRTVTVVDILPAPPDSQRSASRFVLGTEGLQAAVKARHEGSGSTLFDVGTWHSHLTDQGPSEIDRSTAAELAAERPPPSALLIVTPARLHALMHLRQRTTAVAAKG
jgi:proteasome lid subunit RPN8/RPN11